MLVALLAPVLRGVDNLEVGPGGELLVAEDGDDMQLVVVTPDGRALPLLQVVGHTFSEITGPAFSPDHSRLYVSSQRGTSWIRSNGVTFEITGPFRDPAGPAEDAPSTTTTLGTTTTTLPPKGTLVIQGTGDVNLDLDYIPAFQFLQFIKNSWTSVLFVQMSG